MGPRTFPTAATATAFAAAAAVALSLIAFASPVGAHTKLVAIEPPDGSHRTELGRVVLRFAGGVEARGAHVWLEDDGGTVTLGPADHVGDDPTSLEVAVPPVASGRYRIGFHIIAADGAVVGGSSSFTFMRPIPSDAEADEGTAEPPALAAAPAPSSATPPTDHVVDLPPAIARIVLDTALATLIGGVAFVATVWPQGAGTTAVRRLLRGAVIAAAVASAAAAIVQHAAAARLPLLQAMGPEHLVASLEFGFGRVAVARIALLALAAALATRLDRTGGGAIRSRLWCAAAGAVGIGLCETIVLVGHHAHAGALGGLPRFAHAVGVSVWFGGLVVLLAAVLPRRRPDEVGAVLGRFSMLATVAVALSLVAGVGLAVELAGVEAVSPSTTYGRTLLLKVAVVAVLLLVASRARLAVRAWFATASDQRLGPVPSSLAAPMAGVVGVELALIVVVLGLTARLVSQAPPS